ncbi:hypothetical protein GS942_21360 [Rhodococcus hoagii]|nr:hypothetical protein [Prescottella equi]
MTVISHILGVPIDKRDHIAQISKALSDVVVSTPQQLRSAGIAMATILFPSSGSALDVLATTYSATLPRRAQLVR